MNVTNSPKIFQSSRKNFFRKAVAASIGVCFFVTSTLSFGAPPLAGVYSEVKIDSWIEQLQIPSDLGTIQTVRPGSGVTIIHIQDAHAQKDAQHSIRKILKYLNSQHEVNAVFVEGGFNGPISSDILRFFKDEKRNQKIACRLMEKGLASGAGLYLLEGGRKVRAFGIEDPELYLKQLEQFRDVYRWKGEAEKFLEAFHNKISTLASRYLSPDLKSLLEDRLLIQDSKKDIHSHLKTLERLAKSELFIDLHDPASQFDYPQLVRFFKLSELESKRRTDSGKPIEKERQLLLTWLQQKNLGSYLHSFESLISSEPIPHQADPRTFLEEFYLNARPKGFRFEQYPELRKVFARTILQNELDASRLISEIEKLYRNLVQKMAWTSEEKELAGLFEKQAMLRKLFALEMSREEFEKMQTKVEDYLPSRLTNSPADLLASLSSPNGSIGDPMDSRFRGNDTANPDSIFKLAVEFYETAIQREEVLFRNLLRILQTEKIEKSVLITGGFHEAGIEQFIREKGLSYLSITPRIQELESNEVYLDRMLVNLKKSAGRSTVPQLTPDHVSIPKLEFYDQEMSKALRGELEEMLRGEKFDRTKQSLGPAWKLQELSIPTDAGRASSVNAGRRATRLVREEALSKPLHFLPLRYSSSFTKNPATRQMTPNKMITNLAITGIEVKKLLAYVAARVIEKILSIARWRKSRLAEVKNVLSDFIHHSLVHIFKIVNNYFNYNEYRSLYLKPLKLEVTWHRETMPAGLNHLQLTRSELRSKDWGFEPARYRENLPKPYRFQIPQTRSEMRKSKFEIVTQALNKILDFKVITTVVAAGFIFSYLSRKGYGDVFLKRPGVVFIGFAALAVLKLTLALTQAARELSSLGVKPGERTETAVPGMDLKTFSRDLPDSFGMEQILDFGKVLSRSKFQERQYRITNASYFFSALGRLLDEMDAQKATARLQEEERLHVRDFGESTWEERKQWLAFFLSGSPLSEADLIDRLNERSTFDQLMLAQSSEVFFTLAQFLRAASPFMLKDVYDSFRRRLDNERQSLQPLTDYLREMKAPELPWGEDADAKREDMTPFLRYQFIGDVADDMIQRALLIYLDNVPYQKPSDRSELRQVQKVGREELEKNFYTFATEGKTIGEQKGLNRFVFSSGVNGNKVFFASKAAQPNVLIADLDHFNEIESFVFQNLFFESILSGFQGEYGKLFREINELKKELYKERANPEKQAGIQQQITEKLQAKTAVLLKAREKGFDDILARGKAPILSRKSVILVKSEEEKDRVKRIITTFFAMRRGEKYFLDILNAANYNNSRMAATDEERAKALKLNQEIARELDRQRSFVFKGGIFHGKDENQILEALDKIVTVHVVNENTPSTRLSQGARKSRHSVRIRYRKTDSANGIYQIFENGRRYDVSEDNLRSGRPFFYEWRAQDQEELLHILKISEKGNFRAIAAGTGDPTPFSGHQDFTNLIFAFNGRLVLIDPSPRTIQNLQKMRLMDKVEAVYLTHVHADHVGGTIDLIYQHLHGLEPAGGRKIKFIAARVVLENTFELIAEETEGLWKSKASDFKEIFQQVFEVLTPNKVEGDNEIFELNGVLQGMKFVTRRTYGHPIPTFGFRLEIADQTERKGKLTLGYLVDSMMPEEFLTIHDPKNHGRKTKIPNPLYEAFGDFFGDFDLLIAENGTPGIHITPAQLLKAFPRLVELGTIFTVHSPMPQNLAGLQRLETFRPLLISSVESRQMAIRDIESKLAVANPLREVWKLNEKMRRHIARIGRKEEFPQGYPIFLEGDPVSKHPYFYIVLKGEVDVLGTTATLRAGDIVGEMGILGKEVDGTKYADQISFAREIGVEKFGHRLMEDVEINHPDGHKKHLIWKYGVTRNDVENAFAGDLNLKMMLMMYNDAVHPPRSKTVSVATKEAVLVRVDANELVKILGDEVAADGGPIETLPLRKVILQEIQNRKEQETKLREQTAFMRTPPDGIETEISTEILNKSSVILAALQMTMEAENNLANYVGPLDGRSFDSEMADELNRMIEKHRTRLEHLLAGTTAPVILNAVLASQRLEMVEAQIRSNEAGVQRFREAHYLEVLKRRDQLRGYDDPLEIVWIEHPDDLYNLKPSPDMVPTEFIVKIKGRQFGFYDILEEVKKIIEQTSFKPFIVYRTTIMPSAKSREPVKYAKGIADFGPTLDELSNGTKPAEPARSELRWSEEDFVQAYTVVATVSARILGERILAGSIAERVKRAVLPELFVDEQVPTTLSPEMAFVLAPHQEFALNIFESDGSISPAALEKILSDLRPVLAANPNKLLVVTTPFTLSDESKRQISNKLLENVFIFDNVNDYPAFMNQLALGRFEKLHAVQAASLLNKARMLNPQKSFRSPGDLLPYMLAAGTDGLFRPGDLSRVSEIPERFMMQNLSLRPEELLAARISLGLIASGKRNADVILQAVNGYLLVEVKDAARGFFNLYLNPERLEAISALVHALQAHRKLLIAA